jgi:uroporphyrinogen-III decarboxylase
MRPPLGAEPMAQGFLPVELVFNPNWWYHTAGISFEEPFYLDAPTRIQNDITMRRLLHERYGDLGLGQPNPQPRPIIGSVHVAGGFVIPALLGAEILFAPDAAPQPKPLRLSASQIAALEVPDWGHTWPMDRLLADMETLEAEYGYVVGDLNTDGLLNAAYHLYGEQLFLDIHRSPERAQRLLDLIGELIVDIALAVRQRTGSCSLSVNRMVAHVDRTLFLHANCSVPMISPQSYRRLHLPVEQRMARRIQPFGIHHCGDNLHKVAAAYGELPLRYVEVGWGSDVAAVRRALPGVFLNLRLSPVRMLQGTAAQAARDTEALLRAAGPLEHAGLCCINMDYGTPDDNLFAMYEVVQRYRRYGA